MPGYGGFDSSACWLGVTYDLAQDRLGVSLLALARPGDELVGTD
jgi:hypothetical protein